MVKTHFKDVNERISIRRCQSHSQRCVYCGILMGKGKIALSLTNAGDELTLRKNLWMHIKCAPGFAKDVKKTFDSIKTLILAEEL